MNYIHRIKWNSLTWWERGTAFVYHLYREMMLLLSLVIKRFFQINRPLILVDVEILGWVFRVCLNGIRYLCIYACEHHHHHKCGKCEKKYKGNENGFSLKIVIVIFFRDEFFIFFAWSSLQLMDLKVFLWLKLLPGFISKIDPFLLPLRHFEI